MGDQDTPSQRSFDGLLADTAYAERHAALQHQVGDSVTVVSYPDLVGCNGIIIHINARHESPYTVALAGGGIVYCREADLMPASKQGTLQP